MNYEQKESEIASIEKKPHIKLKLLEMKRVERDFDELVPLAAEYFMYLILTPLVFTIVMMVMLQHFDWIYLGIPIVIYTYLINLIVIYTCFISYLNSGADGLLPHQVYILGYYSFKLCLRNIWMVLFLADCISCLNQVHRIFMYATIVLMAYSTIFSLGTFCLSIQKTVKLGLKIFCNWLSEVLIESISILLYYHYTNMIETYYVAPSVG